MTKQEKLKWARDQIVFWAELYRQMRSGLIAEQKLLEKEQEIAEKQSTIDELLMPQRERFEKLAGGEAPEVKRKAEADEITQFMSNRGHWIYKL